MIIIKKSVSITILLYIGFACCNSQDENLSNVNKNNLKLNDATKIFEQTSNNRSHFFKNQKYSSRIPGSKSTSTEKVFGIRTFPTGKSYVINENVKIDTKIKSTKSNVLDFRIPNKKKDISDKFKNNDENNDKIDITAASNGDGKQKKEVEDEEEKTLAQQVADGKYGLIQNEIFINGSKRPGILSYLSNTEVPKDTKDNLGGLEKDEIWLAEDHILVLRGGNYQDLKESNTPSSVWPPIDNYHAPQRQVKIPKNPEIPPPFPVQLSEDGPVEFIKGRQDPPAIPPISTSPPPFIQKSNKTVQFNVPFPGAGNKTLPFPIPPHLLPPFLSNLPPGATFVAPPDNKTEIDEDDPSIYYPPRYDFYYPQDNTTAVPPGPLVPGIILPPPPDFFSVLDNNTDSSFAYHNETDDSINSVTPNSFQGPKYLPVVRKQNRPRISTNRYLKRPISVSNLSDFNNVLDSSSKTDKQMVTYIYPENLKLKFFTTTTPPQNSFRTSVKVSANKLTNSFTSPIFVPSNPNRSVYHPLPTTSPKPNHITLPTTKTLPKQILIITTPETVDKVKIEDIYKQTKTVDANKYEHISPEIHPLRSLIKPNVTVSYNGKYGHLPLATASVKPEPDKKESEIVSGHYVTQQPVTKASKIPTTNINSITVTPIPVVKKIRVHPAIAEKKEKTMTSANPSKATFYFYEEPATTENPPLPEKSKDASPTQTKTSELKENEKKPITQYYYTTKTTNKTPIRQYLEETFHSSNVLPRKPQIAHINNAEIITQNSYPDIPKMKHLNYGTQVPSKPPIKYHYVTEDNTVIIPSPKIKDLEIKNSGSSGLQNVNLDKVSVRPTPKPIIVQEPFKPTLKPETQNPSTITYEATEKPSDYQNSDGPFIPSNYYATVRPEHIHFTSQEQTLVDDITKNYFTIFGQKINSGSTTPLTPIKPINVKSKNKPESGLSYISEDGNNFKIQQVHDSSRKPAKSSAIFFSSDKQNQETSPRPPSNFEKYLKELTGEDQKDFIITGVFPAKNKKGKGFLGPGSFVQGFPPHLLSQGPIPFQNRQPPFPQVTSDQRSNLPYHSGFSTTLRPVDVEIKPQIIQHLSTTSKPFGVYSPQILPQNIRFSQNFQQYLQEITGLTSPTTTRPIKVKKPNLEFFPTTSPLKPLGFQHSTFQIPDVKQKPISLDGDTLVNYKQPRPAINPQAELINIHSPSLAFDVSPNIKIVDSPDLSRNQPYSTKQITFGVAKDFFENIPKLGYFPPAHQTEGNSFVSYNLPGNGGHFYFLTPQILHKEAEENQRQTKNYKRVSRSNYGSSEHSLSIETGRDSKVEHSLEDEYSNHDYLRRRKKKP